MSWGCSENGVLSIPNSASFVSSIKFKNKQQHDKLLEGRFGAYPSIYVLGSHGEGVRVLLEQRKQNERKACRQESETLEPKTLVCRERKTQLSAREGPRAQTCSEVRPALLPLGSAHHYPRTRWLPPNHRVCRNPKWKWKWPKHIRSPGPMERDFM